MMKLRAVGWVLSSWIVMSSAACSKTDANGAAGSSSAAGAPAGTSAPAAKCSDGELADPNGSYCVKLPGGPWASTETKSKTGTGKDMTDFFIKATPPRSDGYVTGFYRDTADVDYDITDGNIDTDSKNSGGIEEKGALAKGTGKYFIYTGLDKTHHCKAFAKRAKMFVKVSFDSPQNQKLPADLIAACKSVYAPGS
jgi:hypothetical protein